MTPSPTRPDSETPSILPSVNEDDIRWACKTLGLRNLDAMRTRFLRETSRFDVCACPGSGKTTLVIAKLAIMARKWPWHSRGICVLSHTNAARNEIERRLPTNAKQLLDYPHCVDTIHGFTNRFLALPWLRSNDFPPPLIDDDITERVRRSKLGAEHRAVATFLEKKHLSIANLRLTSPEYDFCVLNRDGKEVAYPAGETSRTHRATKNAIKATAQAGYLCHDEIFVWAKALLAKSPDLAACLRHRFPLVLIDEMQDCDDIQLAILETLFPSSEPTAVVQRVGDQNQAIYETPPNGVGRFPDLERRIEISNSLRFDQAIADLANPFAVAAVRPHGLRGEGPPGPHSHAGPARRNAIFVFSRAEAVNVIPAYGHHLLTVFDDHCLRSGPAFAVGGVHRDASDVGPEHEHYPKTLSHYWPGYSPDFQRCAAFPRLLVDYLRAARSGLRLSGEASVGLDLFATGLLHLARILGDNSGQRRRHAGHGHRGILAALAGAPSVAATYREVVQQFLIESAPLTEESWRARHEDLVQIGCSLGAPGNRSNVAASVMFLAWGDAPAYDRDAMRAPNVCRVANDAGRHIDVRMGSIHSVKGQTHLATLLLSTYWHGHSATMILPWLTGKYANGERATARGEKLLRQSFVALTRPTHLVCLAMPQASLGDGSTKEKNISALAARGWSIAELLDGSTRWHDE